MSIDLEDSLPIQTMPVAKTGSISLDVTWIAPVRAFFQLDRVGVEYQPLIDLKTGAVTGYEALARFFDENGDRIDNDRVFSALHRFSPETFLSAERDMKRLQIGNAPADQTLFLNFDPCGLGAMEPDVAAGIVKDLFCGRDRLVVEIVENSTASKIRVAEAVMGMLAGKGIPIALDDIGAPGSVMSWYQLKTATFLKFDRGWLANLDDDHTERPNDPLRAMIGYARSTGKTTVLEGVETAEHLAFARETGFDVVQGFLYRDRFLTAEQPIWNALSVNDQHLAVSQCSMTAEKRIAVN